MQTVPPRHKHYRRNISTQGVEPYTSRLTKMSEFPSTDGVQSWSDMAAVSEKLGHGTGPTALHTVTKKGPLGPRTTSSTTVQATTSAQIVSNTQTSTTSSRVAKTSLSTSTVSSSRASHMKSDLNELKSSISEMKTISASQTVSRLRSSMDNLVDTDDGDYSEPVVTFPDTDSPPPVTGPVTLTAPGVGVGMDTVKFEQKKMTSASSTKVVTDGFSAEKAVANTAEMKRVQAGDVSYQENSAGRAMLARLDMDGVTAEKSQIQKQSTSRCLASVQSMSAPWPVRRGLFRSTGQSDTPMSMNRPQSSPVTNCNSYHQEQSCLKAGDISQQESRNMSAASMKLQTDTFSSEKTAVAAAQQRQTVTSQGIFNQEKLTQSSQSNVTISSKGMCTKSSMVTSAAHVSHLKNEDDLMNMGFEDLEQLSTESNQQDVDRAISKYSTCLDLFVKSLRDGNKRAPTILNRINDIMQRAWAVPTHGHELGYSLCNALRNCGGLDILMANCTKGDRELQFSSARLLEQCLTTENRAHVVQNGLDKVVKVACVCTKNANSVDHSRVGTGILEHLFKHSEETCSDVIRLGGLDAVLFECRKNDVETLRHCAGALANLSLYGGAENQEAMIKRKVPMWLFPLAFHNDDNIKYYACLAITVLVANIEIEGAVINSGTLDLVEPFVTSHNPSEFAKSNLAHAHGQSKNWLQRLVPVLSSKREEARNLAAFHFCMEAGIKKQQGNTEIFREISAIEPLKKVASCPNAVASKYAAQALRLIGEEVPHKLSQQVPLWSTEDVREWVKQIGFTEYAANFVESRVDGDLLLQLTEDNLKEDIGLVNGIQRRRFTRELQNLKKMADYSSRDRANISTFLQSMGMEYSIYTYSMLNAGVDNFSLRSLSEDQLLNECGITNSIHRIRIMDAIRAQENSLANSSQENLDKSLDVFVSYRRSNGSQLASLLKVHLQLRGFSVFIDVERLEAGKFDNNLLQSIRQAKHFLLVLTPKALDRCIADNEGKDWVHREIVAALNSQCNIIPIIDNFSWPEPEDLPEDMRAVCHFNGVRWIHDYQDACVDKLERFMRGELSTRPEPLSRGVALNKGDATPGTPSNAALTRQPPSYQRMHSNDSGSGKGSDKDVNGNSGTTRD